MKAQDFLRKGADLLEERGKQYDQPGGERSMGKTVRAFNTITGCSLSEAEGWLLLQILKDVRQWQNPEKYHADSAEDCVSYAALKAEALASEGGIRDGWTDETIKAASFAHGGQISPGAVYRAGEQSLPCNSPVRGIYVDPYDEPAASIDDDSARMQAIGQNGNTGEHYDDAPSWDDAPEWAMWLAQDWDGYWCWFHNEPYHTNDGRQWIVNDTKYEILNSSERNESWMNTLQARPTKEAI